ncbi:unnamed protein product [Oppiella nova]|uniref:RING-type domain-containing protein n=1 Tax=Oppiella nova TaxID=334625 RepID=A0A7R9QU85_9ACAR|nr:unnamed protein product [Oppiella nova]CAG2175107.1 unnamed protein product [Oppiella nova]
MSGGYDSERFSGLQESDIEELSCGICLNIIKAPVIVPCCRQAFCHDCISDWLTNNNDCPLDRAPLTVDGLQKPPRLLETMLGKLKISCDNKDYGCPEVVPLEDLDHHKANCEFKATQCPRCLCDKKPNHDCIEALMQLNRNANQEIQSLKHQTSFNMAAESDEKPLKQAPRRHQSNGQPLHLHQPLQFQLRLQYHPPLHYKNQLYQQWLWVQNYTLIYLCQVIKLKLVTLFKICDKIPDEVKQKVTLFHVFLSTNNGSNVIFITNYDFVYGLGDNCRGCLGFGHNFPVESPQIVQELCHKNIKQFYNGGDFVLAETTNNKLYAWGVNTCGQLARKLSKGSVYFKPGPEYFNDKPIKQICCGFEHTLVLTHSGQVYAWGEGLVYSWGNNYQGMLGHNVPDECIDKPKFIPNLNESCT